MANGIGFSGLNEVVDGPAPLPPIYGLLQTAGAPAQGVRIIPDVDERGIERWLNGASVWPYTPDTGDTYDPCAMGTDNIKSSGTAVPLPEFGALTAYVPETCTTYQVPDQDAYKARAVAVMTAIESSIVAREFMNGLRFPDNPHLADGNGDFPNNDSVTNFPNAIRLLENAISETGRQGIIHCTPGLLSAAAARYGWNYWHDAKNGAIRMISGTLIVPDAGYVNANPPNGHAAATGSQEWIYATGPIDIRRSEIFVMPPRVEQAVDRGTGATTGLPNSVTYRAERYYLVDWDTVLQAAVLCDTCQDEC